MTIGLGGHSHRAAEPPVGDAGPDPAPPWMARWPRCHPRLAGPWTLARAGAWASLEPESGRVWPAVPGRDRRLPGLAPALAAGGRLVAYRVGSRAVVADGDRWIKVVRPSRRTGLAEVTARVAGDLGRRGVAVPEVLRCHDDGRVELSTVPGRSLHVLLREAGDGIAPSAAIEATARAMADLHELSVPAGAGDRVPDPPERGVALVGRAEPAATERLRELAAALGPLPATGSPALVHGDLHDKNVLVDVGRGSVGFIDLDGVGAGWAEDDVANLAVHLELRAMQAGYGSAVGRRWADRLSGAYRARRPLDDERFRAAERWIWFRLGCLYRFRAAGRPLADRLLGRALDPGPASESAPAPDPEPAGQPRARRRGEPPAGSQAGL